METKYVHEAFDTVSFGPIKTTTATLPRSLSVEQQANALLLVSEDAGLDRNLRRVMDPAGFALVQVREAGRALRRMDSLQPAVVFVDLDLRDGAGWEVADQILKADPTLPLVLLTGRDGHIELGTAISAGMVFSKSASPLALLEQTDRLLSEIDCDRRERNARNQLLVRWLMPCASPVQVKTTARYWGINE